MSKLQAQNCLTCKFLEISTKDLTLIRLLPKESVYVKCSNLQQQATKTKDWPDFKIKHSWLLEYCGMYEEKRHE